MPSQLNAAYKLKHPSDHRLRLITLPKHHFNHLGDWFGTFDIESLSMLLNKNFVSVALTFTLVVPDSARDPAPTFTGTSIAKPSIIRGTNIFSLQVQNTSVDQLLLHAFDRSRSRYSKILHNRFQIVINERCEVLKNWQIQHIPSP